MVKTRKQKHRHKQKVMEKSRTASRDRTLNTSPLKTGMNREMTKQLSG